MSTRTAALGYERNGLLRTWVAVCAIVIVATVAIAFAVTRADHPATPVRDTTAPAKVVDYGPPSTTHQPIVVNGVVCGQCR